MPSDVWNFGFYQEVEKAYSENTYISTLLFSAETSTILHQISLLTSPHLNISLDTWQIDTPAETAPAWTMYATKNDELVLFQDTGYFHLQERFQRHMPDGLGTQVNVPWGVTCNPTTCTTGQNCNQLHVRRGATFACPHLSLSN
jgi:hypothetical protein